jgi:hypothetical protein
MAQKAWNDSSKAVKQDLKRLKASKMISDHGSRENSRKQVAIFP